MVFVIAVWYLGFAVIIAVDKLFLLRSKPSSHDTYAFDLLVAVSLALRIAYPEAFDTRDLGWFFALWGALMFAFAVGISAIMVVLRRAKLQNAIAMHKAVVGAVQAARTRLETAWFQNVNLMNRKLLST